MFAATIFSPHRIRRPLILYSTCWQPFASPYPSSSAQFFAMAFPGMQGVPGMTGGGANAGMSEQEQQMVKMVWPTFPGRDRPSDLETLFEEVRSRADY